MPLSDWRDEDAANGNPDGMSGPDDANALRYAITAGEGFDWYYASDADRAARRRKPITDGLRGKPWVFRYKDLRSWWQNAHFDQVRGAEKLTPTAWVRGRNRSGSPNSAARRWTRVRRARMSFPIRNRRKTLIPIFPAEAAPTASSDGFWRRISTIEGKGDAAMVDPNRVYMWTGMRGRSPPFRRTARLGAMGPTGVPAIG